MKVEGVVLLFHTFGWIWIQANYKLYIVADIESTQLLRVYITNAFVGQAFLFNEGRAAATQRK